MTVFDPEKTQEIPLGRWIEMSCKGCVISIEPRPSYCDRGNFIAKVSTDFTMPRSEQPHLDSADLWPRYYFSLDAARSECEAWAQKRGQAIGKSGNWKVGEHTGRMLL